MLKPLIIIFSFFISGCVTEQSYVDNNNNARVITFDKQKAAESRLLLGLTYLQNKNFQQAKENLVKAYSYAPERADVNYSLAHFYQQVGDVIQADQFFSQAIEIDPTNSNTLNNYAVFLCGNKQFERAETLFLQAVSNPKYTQVAQTYENMGLCALNSNDFEKALEHLKTASRYDPTKSDIWLSLATVYYAMDNRAQAEQALVKYAGLDNWSPDGYILAILLADFTDQKHHYQTRLFEDYPESKQAFMVQAKQLQASRFYKLRQKYIDNNQLDNSNQLTSSAPSLSSSSSVVDTATSASEPEKLVSFEPIQDDNKVVVERVQWLPIKEQEITVPTYKVKEGDNLFRISVQFNIQMATLQRWNQLNKPQVYTGQKLYIKNPDVYYLVEQAMKLSDVAQKLKINLNKLQNWNQVTQDGMVRAGTRIIKVDLEKY